MFQFSRVATAQLAGARFLSTAATHAPPKKLYGNSGRYAMAAYTAASKVCRIHTQFCYYSLLI